MDLEDIYADGVDAADEILSKALGYEIRKSLNPLHLPDFEKITRSIAKTLKGHAQPVEDTALKKAMSALDAKWTDMTGPARGKLLDLAFGYTGKPVAQAVLPKVEQTLTFAAKDIIPATKKNAILTYDLKVAPNLSLSDDRILASCIVSQGHYVTDHFGQRADLASLQAKGIVANGLARGLGSADITEALHAQLGSQVAGRGAGYWDIIAGVFANRARTVTQLAAFHDAGITIYTWESVLDEATSVQCRFMHGRTFQVKHAMNKFDQVEQETADGNPEAIKSVQPFLQSGKTADGQPGIYYNKPDGARAFVAHVEENTVGQKDKVGAFSHAHEDADLAAAGIHAPPIHGRCRSTIIPGETTGGASGTAVPPTPAGPPPKLTSGQAKAKAMELLGVAQTLGDPEYLNPDHIFAQTAVNDDPPHLEHPFFSGPDAPGWHDGWAVNAVSKKPKLDGLIPTSPDVLASEVKDYIQKPKSLDAAAAPKVVKLNDKLYVLSGHEQLAAQKFLGQKVAYCDVVDLDKPLKTAPLVEPPPAESALGHVIHPVEPAAPPPPPPLSPALGHPAPHLDGETILGTKTGNAEGSNAGGFYKGTDGVERYVKFYKDPAQAEGEHLANSIYRDMGHLAPVSNVFEHDGAKAYASDIISDAHTLKEMGLSATHAKEVMKGFVADVLVGNWDVVGQDLDNVMINSKNQAIRIDNGGSFLMRAKAGRKPEGVLNQISEWDKFFGPGNPSYQKVAQKAGYMHAGDMKDLILPEIKKVTDLRDAHGGWIGYVNKIAPGLMGDDKAKIVEMLDARTKLLEDKAAEMMRPEPLDRLQPVIGHLPASRLPERFLPIPNGMSEPAWKAQVAARVPKAHADTFGVVNFTGSDYRPIRIVEQVKTPEEAYRHVDFKGRTDFEGTYEEHKRSADSLERFFEKATPTPCTVYRGMHGLPDDVMSKLLANPHFEMSASTSTSRTPDVAMQSNFGNIHEYSQSSTDNRVLMILKQRTAVAVETISSVKHENELLIRKGTKFRVTGAYRAEGYKNVLILEGEEVGNELVPEAPAKKPRKPRAKPATG